MKLISQASSRELRLMDQCLELYYRQSKSRKDIATTLGVSAATVSRLLKRAFDERLVRVELDLPRLEGLESALAHAYGLRQAVVVVAGGRGDLKAELGGAAAAHFEKIARNGMRVGLRSEEHTSELQSQFHLVCRLLLEKKKKNTQLTTVHKTSTPHHISTH